MRRNHSTGSSSINKPAAGDQHKIYFLSALATIHVPFHLLTGVKIVTVAANGKTSPAILTLSIDRFTTYIRRDPSATPRGSNSVFSFGKNRYNDDVEDRAIDIGEIYRVQRGQSTQQFEFAKKHAKVDKHHHHHHINNNSATSSSSLSNAAFEVILKRTDLERDYSDHGSNSSLTIASNAARSMVLMQQLDPSLSFSIIFRGAHTVDLMAQTNVERDEICGTLDAILLAYQRGKIRVSTDVLLLRYVFLDVDKEKTGYVTANQMGKVLQAVNFNMKQKDVINAYEKFGKVIGLDRLNRRKGLTFEQAATFLHKVCIFDYD